MPVSYTILVPPTSEPLTLSEAKDYLNVDFDDKDALINRLIGAARRYAENMTRRSLATQTIQMIHEPDQVAAGALSGPVDVPFDAWTGTVAERPDIPLFGNARLVIPCVMGPVQSLTSVEYQLTRMDQPEWTMLAATDAGNNPNYRLDTVADPNELNIFMVLAASRYRLTYVAGSDALTDRMYDYRPAMLSLINHWYEHREGEPVPDGIRQLFCERRVFML